MQLQENLCFIVFMVVAEYLLVLIASLCDLKSGIRKAKLRHEKITSDGWRRTVKKLCGYYNLMACLTVIDTMQMVGFYYLDVFYAWSIPLFPIITFFGAIAFGGIEVKSIYEKAEDKTKKQANDVGRLLANALENTNNPKAIAAEVIKYLGSVEHEKKE